MTTEVKTSRRSVVFAVISLVALAGSLVSLGFTLHAKHQIENSVKLIKENCGAPSYLARAAWRLPETGMTNSEMERKRQMLDEIRAQVQAALQTENSAP